ncbi:DUF6456 domain-containing protein [Roseibium sp.]|uniref:DUF6456 domain-containing protein n=1 Tax=Roseibium sp. TaxID=1936156 RepID=UPI003A9832ED
MTARQSCPRSHCFTGKGLLKSLAVAQTRLIRPDCGDQQALWQLQRGGKNLGRYAKAAEVRKLAASGALAVSGDGLILTREGKAALRRALSSGDGFAAQHREIVEREIPARSEPRPERLTVNLRESPLAWLASRKDRKGKALLGRVEVEAGERLRADYDFARLMPSIAGGWRVESSGQVKAGGRSKVGEMNDDVIAARRRVERTLTQLEPALASVLVDVCCHLKGLEKVEAERGWPARSGKVVLQIALSSLADRYGLRTIAGEGSGRIRTERKMR